MLRAPFLRDILTSDFPVADALSSRCHNVNRVISSVEIRSCMGEDIVATAAPAKPQTPPTEETLAARYAGDLVYKALIETGEPLKASEVAKAVDHPDVDMKLARVVLATTVSMTAVDRKWTIWTRYLDVNNTVDRNIHRVLNAFGQPIRIMELARELGTIYDRPAEVYEEMLSRLVLNRKRFFLIADEYVAPAEWLLNTDDDDEDEVLFDNFLEDEDVFPYVEVAREAGLDNLRAENLTAFLDKAGVPIKNKALQFLAYHLNHETFDAERLYTHLFLDSGAVALSDGTWIGPQLAQKLTKHFPKLAEQEVSDDAEKIAQEAAQPLALSEESLAKLVQSVVDSDDTVFASRLLSDQFEITPDDRTYEEDLRTIIHALSQDERVMWAGGERFRPQGTVPGYVFSVPGLLDIPEDNYRDEDGNLVDVRLEDDGFNGGLEREILNPLAQDVLDEEPVPSPDMNPPSNARAVIKYHHKQIGTLPLCQFPSGFFPPEPAILETEFSLPGSQKAQVWVNNETRLMYGLLDWFQSIPIDSGATFTLERQAGDRYIVNYNDESEPTMFISRNRINELLELQERAETDDISTFDVMREIMEHYRKGIEFITLLTEVNVVRRTPRRMVASILSEYHCFTQRGGAWVFDTKKLIQGFDKSKRKFIAK